MCYILVDDDAAQCQVDRRVPLVCSANKTMLSFFKPTASKTEQGNKRPAAAVHGNDAPLKLAKRPVLAVARDTMDRSTTAEVVPEVISILDDGEERSKREGDNMVINGVQGPRGAQEEKAASGGKSAGAGPGTGSGARRKKGDVETLCAMGFEKKDAERALRVASGSVERAADWLLAQ